MGKIRIEDKPVWCSAWCSKISDQVMCNTMQCCGFAHTGKKDMPIKGFSKDNIGKHPLVNGLFQFSDGTFKDETPK